jgi:cytosine permease
MSEKKTGFEIKPEQRQSWFSIAMIWIGAMICVPCLMIGGFLGMGFTIPNIIICVLIGYGIVCTYMCFMGMQGCDTGLPTSQMAAGALGDKGAQLLISLLLGIACIGWFGIQSAVCGASFSAMIAGMTGFTIPVWISSVFWGLIMLLTAMFGYKGLKYLNFVAVPALVLVLIYGLWVAFVQKDGAAVLASYQPVAPMTIVMGINLVVATFALGGVISGDYCRFARNRGDVIKSSVLGVLPMGLIMLLIGAVLSIVAGAYDISVVLSAVGVPALGLVALVLATWTTNVTNAYSGGLAVASLLGLDETKFKITTGISGLLGTILAAVGFITKFQTFLGILTAFIPPVAGVVIANYWIVGRGKKERFQIKSGFSLAGLLAFVLGAAVAYLTANVWVFFVGPINGIVVSLIAYVVLIKVIPDQKAVTAGDAAVAVTTTAAE